jgi:prevent-host-death family protein
MVKIKLMKITVTDAKGQLTDLVRRPEAGEEVVLTRHWHPVARLVPAAAQPKHDPEMRRKIIEDIVASARGKATPGPRAARSQDFLYDEYGLPK